MRELGQRPVDGVDTFRSEAAQHRLDLRFGIREGRRLAEEPVKLGSLAAEFGISPERVRQIETRAFDRVQQAVKSRLAARRPTAIDLPALAIEAT